LVRLLPLFVALLAPVGGRAATVEAKAKVLVRERPAPNARVVDRVGPGKKLTLIERSADGKWAQVDTGRVEGWVPSGQLKGAVKGRKATAEADEEPAEDEESAKPLAKRRNVRPEAWVSKSRYHDGEDSKLTVSAVKAELYGRPASTGSVVGVLRRGDVVSLVRKSADKKWILVDIGGGESAWVEARSVKPGAAKGARSEEEVAEAEKAEPERAPPPAETKKKGAKFVKAETQEPEPEPEPEPAPPPPPKKGKKAEKAAAAPPPETEPEPPARPSKGDDEAPPGFEKKEAKKEEPKKDEEPPPPPKKKGKKLLASRTDAGMSADGSVTRKARGPHGNNYGWVTVRPNVSIMQTRFTSNVQVGDLVNYESQTTGAGVALGGGYLRQIGKHFLIGFDLHGLMALGGGLRYRSNALGEVVLATQSYTFGGAINVGAHFEKAGGINLRFRLGYAGQLNLIEPNAKLPLPSEFLSGLAIGVGLDMPAIAWLADRPFGLYVGINALPVAVRMQTLGLQEGGAQQSFGVNIAAGFSYGLLARSWGSLGLTLGYQWWLATTQFEGQATDPTGKPVGRNLNITQASRGNAQHDILIGAYFSY
jgi:SH3-like domain-containing protein